MPTKAPPPDTNLNLLPPGCTDDLPPPDFRDFIDSIDSVRRLLPLAFGDNHLPQMLSVFDSAIKGAAHVTAAAMAIVRSPADEVADMAEAMRIPIQEFQKMVSRSPFLPRP